MSTEEPDSGGSEGTAPDGPPPTKRPKDIVSFMKRAQVAVSASNGGVVPDGIPFELFSQLIKKCGAALKGAENLVADPLALASFPDKSMTVLFAEPPLDPDAHPPLELPLVRSGSAVARLIQTDEGESLLDAAYDVGAGAQAYIELLRWVELNGVTLDWQVISQEVERLDPERAAWQYEWLSRPPETNDRPVRVDGLLYRVILDRPGVGSVGVRPLPDSRLPGGGNIVIARYDSEEVETAIRSLVGEVVTATMQIAEPKPSSRIIGKHDLNARIIDVTPCSRPTTLDMFADDPTEDDGH